MERYICIHGHFYQPPRENPWLEAIELQDSAYPYHDWNERISAECYAANAVSRILDGDGRIVQIVNNYSKISFDFGPTLLSWMEQATPEVYQAVVAADELSQRRFSGHGSALAQAYNHMILPLANRRDKYTQLLWGIRDFERRFHRKPEGMWLPEAAVDSETLDILAELGLRFTVLAPHQASRVRRMNSRAWRDVGGARVDPKMAYELRLASGRKINLFFYDGPISRAVAFERLLTNGESFADRLMSAFADAEKQDWPPLAHIATDGETYGHHHRQGDMALAYALHYIESNSLARLTNYGEYLERQPPTHWVEVYENSSWSCAHGVERWRSHCGCNTGGQPGWNQAWRGPLREALDWLRDTVAPLCERKGSELFKDFWATRDDYITVVLDRSPANVEQFLREHALWELNQTEKIDALKLLELQRHAMLMFTSCGWFFDELSGIETVQVMQYAGRALQLSQDLFGDDLESHFLERLERAKSNIPAHVDGRRVYQKFVKPAAVDLEKVAAHYAVSSLFETYPERAAVYCYAAERMDHHLIEAGRAKLVVGRSRISSQVTGESSVISYGVLYLGDHNLNGGVRPFRGDEAFAALKQELSEAFSRADFPEIIRLMDKQFGESNYSLKSLFRDEQRKILNVILEETLSRTVETYRQLYERRVPLMRFLADLGTPIPQAFLRATEVTLNTDLRRAATQAEPDFDRVRTLLEETRMWHVELDTAGLAYSLKQTIERLAEQFRTQPTDIGLLRKLETAADLARSLPFEVDLWRVQNVFYELLKTVYPECQARTDDDARAWVEHFSALGERLSIHVQ